MVEAVRTSETSVYVNKRRYRPRGFQLHPLCYSKTNKQETYFDAFPLHKSKRTTTWIGQAVANQSVIVFAQTWSPIAVNVHACSPWSQLCVFMSVRGLAEVRSLTLRHFIQTLEPSSLRSKPHNGLFSLGLKRPENECRLSSHLLSRLEKHTDIISLPWKTSKLGG
jgi:hypothetical protein